MGVSSFLSRRELLQSFLGLPIALSACRSTPSLPEGSLTFSSEKFGHQLRDQAPPIAPPKERFHKTNVLIVGAGVAGLSAARRLLAAGVNDFVILELESAPGGTSRSESSPLVKYPLGAHYITVPMKENRALLSLLEEIGTVEGYDSKGEPVIAEEQLCRAPQERIFYRGSWYEGLYLKKGETKEEKQQFLQFQKKIQEFASLQDEKGNRSFAIPMATSANLEAIQKLDTLSMSEWLRKNAFTSKRLLWRVDYACRDDYGTTPDETSAWAGIFYFASRMRQKKEQAVITWPEGNGRLVSHLYQTLKPFVRLGVAVADILPHENKPAEILARTQDGSILGFFADQVIFAAPQFLAPYLIHSYRENVPEHTKAFSYSAWMVANLFVKDRPKSKGFPICWDNVLYESPSLGYVVATHQKGIDYGPTVLTYYYPICDKNPRNARKRLLSLGWKEWADIALSDLSQAHPDIRLLTEKIDIVRWGHAMVRPVPGFLFGKERQLAMTPEKSIYFAHSDLSGLGLFEEAFYQGTRAAEEVLRTRKLPFDSLL